jgi:DNA invertase Pin-like site-specific DNA recombinase
VSKVGYARVSTGGQDLALQLDALQAAGCDRIFEEKASGTRTDRPVLAETLAYLREGDTLVVWRLDRLGRSLIHLIETVQSLQDRGIGFQSVTEGIDTSTAGGELVFHVFGALAQFERRLISERTLAGLEASKARGRVGGRPRVLTPDQVRMVRQMNDSGEHTATSIAAAFGVSRATVYRYLNGP